MIETTLENLHEQNAAGWMLARAVLTALAEAERSNRTLTECVHPDVLRRYAEAALDEGTRVRCVTTGHELADIHLSYHPEKRSAR